MVVAEAGIGKTCVVAARLADVDEHGVWIFGGATDELEQRRPRGVIADCLATGRSATERGRATVAGLLAEEFVARAAEALLFHYYPCAFTIENAMRPDFLPVPDRTAKPRSVGLTHVLDKGMAPPDLRVLVDRAGPLIDIWKLGWGTAYLEPDVGEKVAILQSAGVRACVGGTLLEAAWAAGVAEQCLAWAAEMGFSCVEVSNGAVAMPLSEKRRLVSVAARRFLVIAEVGSKAPTAEVSGKAWAEEMCGDLDAGATWALAEGRESGTVGLYEDDGRIRTEVVELVAEAVGLSRVVFEAPRKEQQAWLIRRFGANVNLGNITHNEVFAVEALRLGLRADTIAMAAPGSVKDATADA